MELTGSDLTLYLALSAIFALIFLGAAINLFNISAYSKKLTKTSEAMAEDLHRIRQIAEKLARSGGKQPTAPSTPPPG